MISNKYIILFSLTFIVVSGCSLTKNQKTQHYAFSPTAQNILYIKSKFNNKSDTRKIRIDAPFKLKKEFKQFNQEYITYHKDEDKLLYISVKAQENCSPSIQDINKMNIFGVKDIVTSCFVSDIRERSKIGDKNVKL